MDNNNIDFEDNEETPLAISYNYFFAINQFEQTALEAQTLHFHESRLMPQEPVETEPALVDNPLVLTLGLNTELKLRCRVIRTLKLDHCTCLLTTAEMGLNNNFAEPLAQWALAVCVVVHNENEEEDMVLQCFLKPNAIIQVAQPFRRSIEEASLPSLIVAWSNVTIVSKGKSEGSTEEHRQKANDLFKAGKYVQAIRLYEQALRSILGPSKRVRAILYSNTAACLFELRLFHSCCLYAGVATAIDPSYSKGYYRKINSLLEMRNHAEALPLIVKIQNLVGPGDFQTINIKYSQYMTNESGSFNWGSLVGGTGSQGEFISENVECKWEEGELRYFAKKEIARHELILVGKPLLYMSGGAQFKEWFSEFLREVQTYYLFDAGYEQAIHCLPCKCHPTLLERQQYYHKHFKGITAPLPRKELFNKMQRCIFEEKALDKSEEHNGYGVWPHMFYFHNSCRPNCTALHLNRCLLVSAMQPIAKGTRLSLDLIADVDPSKRQQTLSIKFDRTCDCMLCGTGEPEEGDLRVRKWRVWGELNRKWMGEQDGLQQLIWSYIQWLQRECEWDDVLNLFRLMEDSRSQGIIIQLESVIKRFLVSFLKISEDNMDNFFDVVINKYLGED